MSLVSQPWRDRYLSSSLKFASPLKRQKVAMKTLNQSQKTALWLGIALVVAAGVCPPWKSNGTPLPYALIFHPPASVENADVHIDFERLAVQWLMAAVLTAGLIASTEKGKPDQSANSPGAAKNAAATAPAAAKDKPTQTAATAPAPPVSKTTAEPAAAEKVAERVLKFPANQSIGEILIESQDDSDYWESLAPAKGAVKLPTGRHIQFELNKDSVFALDSLTDLPSDTFFSMDLSATRISDADLKTIQHFSELSELDLSDTSVTDEGIKHLLALTKLKKLWLDNTGVTEQGLENLQNLGQLTKVSLIGVKVSEPEVQTLKSKFSNCEIVLQEGKA
jgi:hypothetical protein